MCGCKRRLPVCFCASVSMLFVCICCGSVNSVCVCERERACTTWVWVCVACARQVCVCVCVWTWNSCVCMRVCATTCIHNVGHVYIFLCVCACAERHTYSSSNNKLFVFQIWFHVLCISQSCTLVCDVTVFKNTCILHSIHHVLDSSINISEKTVFFLFGYEVVFHIRKEILKKTKEGDICCAEPGIRHGSKDFCGNENRKLWKKNIFRGKTNQQTYFFFLFFFTAHRC